MPEIKITQMPELLPFDSYSLEGGTAPDDYLPIIDTSETTAALKNKKVAISTLFEQYLNAEDTRIEITDSIRAATVDRITLTNNSFQVSFNTSQYLFLDPNGVNRTLQVNLFNTGLNKYIKNIGTTNTLTLENMVTNNNTSVLSYVIPVGKTVHVIYDGIDHHVIPLD